MKYLICFIWLSAFTPLSATTLLTPEKIEIIHSGEEALLNARWDQAYRTYDSLCTIDSSDPVGYLYRAVVLQTEMTDREEVFRKREFTRLLDKAERLAENYMNGGCSKRDSAICQLYIGHQHAYRAVWETRFGSSISAITYGFKAKGAYQKGLEIDSTFYDLYLGMGSYHYWKSVKSGFLRYTGIFNDDREQGIEEIHLAIDSSLISRDAAKSSLIYILMNEKKYDSAILISDEMYERYPEGNFFLWPIAESYREMDNHEKTREYYKLLYDRLKEKPGNYYNLIEAVYYYYLACEKLDCRDEAYPAVKELIEAYRDIPREIVRKQRTKLTYLRRRY